MKHIVITDQAHQTLKLESAVKGETIGDIVSRMVKEALE